MASVVAVAVNAAVAWAIVLGRWGFSPHGVAGSAWAQNIGVGTELLIVIGFAALPVARRQFASGDWRFRPGVMRELLKMGIPSGVQIVAEVLAWSAFSMWVMAPFGTGAMGANIFVFRYMSVSFMPAFGLSVAVTALVGRYIGKGDPATAVARANLGVRRHRHLHDRLRRRPVRVPPAADRPVHQRPRCDPHRRHAAGLRRGLPTVRRDLHHLHGGLRGAGDTLVPAIVLAVLCWGIVVGVGRVIADTVPAWGPIGPWIAATAYGGILSVFIYTRFIRGKWRRVTLPNTEDFQPQMNTDAHR